MTKEIIQQGAEAVIIKEGNNVIKERISKGYRHPLLDKKIIKQRTKSEAKILEKAQKLIPVPNSKIISENKIRLDFIDGKKLSENLENLNWKELCKTIGNQIALLHDNNIIHGDLTTSNMILQEAKTSQNKPHSSKPKSKDELRINNVNNKHIKNCEKTEQAQVLEQPKSSSEGEARAEDKLFFIDFGLSFISSRIEDKAVDLHLIKQALEAKHFTIHKEAEKIILENYNSKDKTKILEQLKKVELRGRYKH